MTNKEIDALIASKSPVRVRDTKFGVHRGTEDELEIVAITERVNKWGTLRCVYLWNGTTQTGTFTGRNFEIVK